MYPAGRAFILQARQVKQHRHLTMFAVLGMVAAFASCAAALLVLARPYLAGVAFLLAAVLLSAMAFLFLAMSVVLLNFRFRPGFACRHDESPVNGLPFMQE